jgi:tetratricopeptide (TPR) repeat protein
MGAIGHLPPKQAFAEAERYAKRALELDEGAGDTYVAMGIVQLFYHWDWDGAYRSFQKALSLAPGSAEAHQFYGMYLGALGDVDEALEELQTAAALDPLSLPIRHQHADVLIAAGRLEEAEAELQSILLADPSFRAATETLGWIAIARGDPKAALVIFETLPQMAGHRFAAASARGYTLAVLGRTDEAREMLALLEERRLEHPDVTLSVDFALVYRGLGDYDQVFHHLDEVADQRMGVLLLLLGRAGRANPFWGEDIRKDARFDALRERVGHPMMVGA